MNGLKVDSGCAEQSAHPSSDSRSETVCLQTLIALLHTAKIFVKALTLFFAEVYTV